MKSGPRPMPRNLRLVRSSPDKTSKAGRPAKPIDEPPVKIPLPPASLTAEEVDCFVVMAQKLAGMRIMTEMDVDALVIYCRNWLDAKEAHQKVLESGMIVKSPKGYPIVNPWLAVRRKAEDKCLRILAEFGMTPSSRNRVSQ